MPEGQGPGYFGAMNVWVKRLFWTMTGLVGLSFVGAVTTAVLYPEKAGSALERPADSEIPVPAGTR
ncbi:MAG: hypothetical protein IT285_02460 [Bdellovibrionales bacterium]|nr:hypothetical protein [Bdellovibrionales bacterium]